MFAQAGCFHCVVFTREPWVRSDDLRTLPTTLIGWTGRAHNEAGDSRLR